MALTKKFKLTLAGLGIVVLGAIVYVANKNGYLDTSKIKESTTVDKFNLPSAETSDDVANIKQLPMPSAEVAHLKSTQRKMGVMAWNSQMSGMLANGGPQTTQGSLMEKYGVNLVLERQDNCMNGATELVKFARAYKNDKNTTEGYQYYNVMGDGAAAFVAGINSQLTDLGPEYQAFIVPYSMGKSYGEDAVWGPKEWLTDKNKLIGSVIVTVPRDGDWNILVQLCMTNNLKFNWQENTYDPDAVNVWGVDDFVKAGEIVISGQTAEWPVIKNGKRSGTKTVKADGFSSWTPVDANVAEAKGGMVRIVSTKDYDSQMPNVMVTIKKFAQDNRAEIVSMCTAMAEAADQIKAFPETALKKAAEVSQKVYQDQTPTYWMSMYRGRKQEDATGEMVEVGGSKTLNLADNLELYGKNDGSINVYKKVYETFGNIVTKNYPELVPAIVPYNQVTDLSILDEIKERALNGDASQFMAKADVPTFSDNKEITNVVSSANYQINFKTGSADFSPEAYDQLNKILSNALVATNLRIKINGYTDNVGNPDANMELSQRRADAVKNWLTSQAASRFKGNRIQTFAFGQTNPIAPNTTPAGQAKNRRVEIVMGSAE